MTKRYIVVCAACDGLHETSRRNTFSCSSACRVKLHRNPQLMEDLRALCTDKRSGRLELDPFAVLESAALSRLVPESSEIMGGRKTHEDFDELKYQRYRERVDAAVAEYRKATES